MLPKAAPGKVNTPLPDVLNAFLEVYRIEYGEVEEQSRISILSQFEVNNGDLIVLTAE